MNKKFVRTNLIISCLLLFIANISVAQKTLDEALVSPAEAEDVAILLDATSIAKFNSSAKKLINLKKLTLSGVVKPEIQKTFGATVAALTSVEELHLLDNNLGPLFSIRTLTNLKTLHIVGNVKMDYKKLFTELKSAPNLSMLYLSNNEISSFAAVPANFPSLTTLIFDGGQNFNYLELIDVLTSFKTVKTLGFPISYFNALPSTVRNISSMEVLYLDYSMIQSVNAGFKPSAGTEILGLGKVLINPEGTGKKVTYHFVQYEEDLSADDIALFKKMYNTIPMVKVLNGKTLPIDKAHKMEPLKPAEPEDPFKDFMTKDFKVLSDSYLKYDAFMKSDNAVDKKYMYFNERYLDPNYEYTSLRPENGKFDKESKIYLELDPKSPKEEIWFLFTKNAFFNKNFTEINSAFAGMTWKYDGDLTKADFTNQFLKKAMYDDCRVKYDASSSTYTLEFKTATGMVELPASPRMSNTSIPIEKTKLQYSSKYDRYLAGLARKEKLFNSGVDRERALNDKAFVTEQNQKWKEFAKTLSPLEKTWTREQWMQYRQYILDNETKLIEDSPLSYEIIALEMVSEGFENISAVDKSYKSLELSFVNEEGNPLVVQEFKVVHLNNSTMYTYTPSPNAKTTSIKYLPSKGTMIIAKLRDGNIGFIDDSDFIEVEETKDIPAACKLKIYKANSKKIKDIKEDLGLE